MLQKSIFEKFKDIFSSCDAQHEHELAKHLRTGNAAEVIARRYLENEGLVTVATNQSSRFGELDIIMLEEDMYGETLVFVEVRFRSSKSYGSALESVVYKKQSNLIKTARYYLQNNKQFAQHPCRFDIVTVEPPGNAIQWTPCAFTLENYGD